MPVTPDYAGRARELARRAGSGFVFRPGPAEPVTLPFGTDAPDGDAASRWIQTIPGTGWFVYFRIYGPDAPAFDGSWELPDFIRA